MWSHNNNKSHEVISIKHKFLYISSIILVGMVLFLYLAYQVFSTSLENECRKQSKSLSTALMSVVQNFHELSTTGQLTTEQAKAYSLSALKRAHYDQTVNFWVSDGNGKLLMHPFSSQKVNKNLLNTTDEKGKYFMRDMIKIAKSGGGWMTYHWNKPASELSYEKLSYVNYFSDWDWVLGTGVYMDDMNQSIFESIIKASLILFILFILFFFSTLTSINIFATQLETLAISDALTGLYTKRYLNEVKPIILRKQVREREKSLTATFIDVDFFKKVNDQYGHKTGDIVLSAIGDIIEEQTRADDYSIRYGGEEFLLVAFYEDEFEAVMVAERIRSLVSKKTFYSHEHSFNVTISAGIATAKAGEDFDILLERADQQLYCSKHSGRNRVTLA